MGKHPAFGDFVEAGLSRGVADTLTRWIDGTLGALRAQLDEGWPTFWAGAQSLRFWIGADVAGATLAGVLHPSRDRVGRDYPLLMLAEGAALPPPGYDGFTAQDVWDAFDAHLAAVRPGHGGATLLDGLALALEPESAPAAPGTLWAHRPDGDLSALLSAAGRADTVAAARARSYWWAPGGAGRAPVWLGCHGLPDAAAVSWLLSGIVMAGGPDA